MEFKVFGEIRYLLVKIRDFLGKFEILKWNSRFLKGNSRFLVKIRDFLGKFEIFEVEFKIFNENSIFCILNSRFL